MEGFLFLERQIIYYKKKSEVSGICYSVFNSRFACVYLQRKPIRKVS